MGFLTQKSVFLNRILVGFILIWVFLAISPTYRYDWLLENILVFLGLPYFLYLHQKIHFSNLSVLLVFIFLTFHTYGAHYTYSETPIGYGVSNYLGYSRNHYDRFVHFLWGFLLTLPLVEIFHKKVSRKVRIDFLIACSVSLSAGVLYEFMEWATVLLVAPEAGTAFLGTQGDEWDAQKDLLMHTIGAIASFIWIPARYSAKSWQILR
jgi:putative membrane protein